MSNIPIRPIGSPVSMHPNGQSIELMHPEQKSTTEKTVATATTTLPLHSAPLQNLTPELNQIASRIQFTTVPPWSPLKNKIQNEKPKETLSQSHSLLSHSPQPFSDSPLFPAWSLDLDWSFLEAEDYTESLLTNHPEIDTFPEPIHDTLLEIGIQNEEPKEVVSQLQSLLPNSPQSSPDSLFFPASSLDLDWSFLEAEDYTESPSTNPPETQTLFEPIHISDAPLEMEALPIAHPEIQTIATQPTNAKKRKREYKRRPSRVQGWKETIAQGGSGAEKAQDAWTHYKQQQAKYRTQRKTNEKSALKELEAPNPLPQALEKGKKVKEDQIKRRKKDCEYHKIYRAKFKADKKLNDAQNSEKYSTPTAHLLNDREYTPNNRIATPDAYYDELDLPKTPQQNGEFACLENEDINTTPQFTEHLASINPEEWEQLMPISPWNP